MYTYRHIYIYRERERERERDPHTIYPSTYLYITSIHLPIYTSHHIRQGLESAPAKHRQECLPQFICSGGGAPIGPGQLHLLAGLRGAPEEIRPDHGRG